MRCKECQEVLPAVASEYAFCPFCGRHLVVVSPVPRSEAPTRDDLPALDPGGHPARSGGDPAAMTRPDLPPASASGGEGRRALRHTSRARGPAADRPEPDAPVAASPDPDWTEGSRDAAPRTFSETAWFMAGVHPEHIREGTPEDFTDQAVRSAEYEAGQDLPDAVRRKYSLGTTGEHPGVKR